MALEDFTKGAKGALESTLEAAKKLKLGVLDLVPAFIALAKGEGIVKATISAIKWTALSAAVPIVTGVGLAFFSLSRTISAIVKASGSLDAAIGRITQTKGLEKVFDPILKGSEAAKDRVAELVQFSEHSPFELKGVAEASKTMELLGPSSMAFGAGLKTVGDVAAATGNRIEDVAGEIGMLNSQLKSGADISGTINSLKNMGVVSAQTATEIMRLSDSGAGMSIIWSKVQTSMAQSSGGVAKANEEIGNLQGTLEKAKESLKVAFGQPFIDAEKTGIKNSIKTMENLKPALSAVANALAKVTDATSNIKSGFTAWATSVPHLSDLLGGLTRIVTNFGVVIAGAGAVAAAKRFATIGSIISGFREKTGIGASADKLVNAAERHAKASVRLKDLALSAAESGDTTRASKLTSMAKAATVRGRLATGGAAALGEGAAMRTVGSAGLAAAGRLLLSPWFIVPAIVAGAISAVQSVRDSHKGIADAVKQINDATHDTISGLDAQLNKVTTLDDKYRGIVDSTNAIAAAQAKLAELKLPGEDHQITTIQRLMNAFGKFSPAFKETFGKEESKFTAQKRAQEQGIKELQQRRELFQAVPEDKLVTERNINLEKRRAIFTRRTEETESEMRLRIAPTPAARRAILTEQQEKFTSRAQAGEAEATNFDAAERTLKVLDNKLTEPLTKFSNAQAKLTNAGTEDVSQADKTKRIEKRALELQGTTGSPGESHAQAVREERERGIKVKDVGKRNEAMRDRATQIRKSTPGVTEEAATAQAAKERIAKDNVDMTSREGRALVAIIRSENTITSIRTEQANLRRQDVSELEQITQALDDITNHKPAHVLGKEVGKEDLARLAGRQATLQEDIQPQNQEEAKQVAQSKGEEADLERKRSILQAPDLDAERQILNIRSEGLDREDRMSEITDEHNRKELAAVRQIRDEEEKRTGVKVNEEEDPRVRQIEASSEENRRRKAGTANQRKELEFSRKSLEIETTTGRGPAEEIDSLNKQIALTKQQMEYTAKNTTLGKAERAERLAGLAKQAAMMEKAKSDIKFNNDQEVAAAKSATTQMQLQSRGEDFLADLESTRLGYVQKIAQAYRDGNVALGEQLQTQGKLNIAQQLGHKNLGDMVRDENTGNLRELNGSEQAQRARDEQAIKQHAVREQETGQARINQARQTLARGGTTTDTEALAAIKAQDDMEQTAREQSAQRDADRAKQASLANEARVLSSAKEKKVEGKKLTKEEEKALKIEAAPFQEALDGSTVLKGILDAAKEIAAKTNPGDKGDKGDNGSPGGSGQGGPGGQGGGSGQGGVDGSGGSVQGGTGGQGGTAQGGQGGTGGKSSTEEAPLSRPDIIATSPEGESWVVKGGSEPITGVDVAGASQSSGATGGYGMKKFMMEKAYNSPENQAMLAQKAANNSDAWIAKRANMQEQGKSEQDIAKAELDNRTDLGPEGRQGLYQQSGMSEREIARAELDRRSKDGTLDQASKNQLEQQAQAPPQSQQAAPEQEQQKAPASPENEAAKQAAQQHKQEIGDYSSGLREKYNSSSSSEWTEEERNKYYGMREEQDVLDDQVKKTTPQQPGQGQAPGQQPTQEGSQDSAGPQSGPGWIKTEDGLLVSRPEKKEPEAAQPQEPALPQQPAQPSSKGDDKGNGDVVKAIQEIKAALDNLGTKIGVA